MIHKIQRLVSIGKFRDYTASGQVNFHKLTTIFGDNGGGKTTLTSIFRSLSENIPNIILQRISTNNTLPQTAQIISREVPNPDIYHTFNINTGWSNLYPNIEIFDAFFVNENIYSGFDFNEEHKKQLHNFVIGAQGVAILQQMEQNKLAKTTSRQVQNGLEQQLIQQVGNNLTTELITSFLSLQLDDSVDITRRITEAELALSQANANSIIQSLALINQIPEMPIEIDFAQLKIDLQTTTDTIEDLVLKKLFEDHCQDLSSNSLDNPETWLRTGFNYIVTIEGKLTSDQKPEINCPFCKQEINSSIDIIKSYTLLFNEEFNSLLNRINIHLDNLEQINITAIIQIVRNNCETNTERVNSWNPYITNTLQTSIEFLIPDTTLFADQFGSLLNQVRSKRLNPSRSVNVEFLDLFSSTLDTIETNRIEYNQNVTLFNNSIATLRARITTVAQAQLEVDRLKRIEQRFLPAVSTVCTQLLSERQNLRTLENAYTLLSQQQQTDATAFFTTYRDRINNYLGVVFNTAFRIDEIENIPPQGRATQSKLNYKLTIDGQDISFDRTQPFCVKDCLSEGDKSTLALAFFLAKLDVDPNRLNKVIIFDDPLSSLDTNRRTYTVGVIRSLLPNIRQLIVLSHNEYFLHEISKDISQADKKSLRITENFVNRDSRIELCDLDKLVQNDYFKHIDALENFRSNPDHNIKDSVLGWLRNVLESHLRFKFYREIRNMTGQKTFGRLITFLDTQGVVFRDNANRANIIATLNLINSVSWMPHHGIPAPNFTTIGINPNTLSAAELDRLILNTLNLINNQI